MRYSVKITGDKETIKAFEKLAEKSQRQVMWKGLTEGGTIVLDAAKENAPVDTGEFRDGLELKVTVGRRSKAKIISTSSHGGFVELGAPGRGIPAQPTMRPALYDNHNAVRGKFITALKTAVREVGLQDKLKEAAIAGRKARTTARIANKINKAAKKDRLSTAKVFNRRAKSNRRLERKANRLLKRLK